VFELIYDQKAKFTFIFFLNDTLKKSFFNYTFVSENSDQIKKCIRFNTLANATFSGNLFSILTFISKSFQFLTFLKKPFYQEIFFEFIIILYTD